LQQYPSDKDPDMKKDWDDCIVAIDDKTRDLKRRLKKKAVVKQGSSSELLSLHT